MHFSSDTSQKITVIATISFLTQWQLTLLITCIGNMQVLPKISTCAAFTGFRSLANKIIQNFCEIRKKLVAQLKLLLILLCFHMRDKTYFLTCCDDLNPLGFSFSISLKDNTTFKRLDCDKWWFQQQMIKGGTIPRDVTVVTAVSPASHTSLREWGEPPHDQQDLRCSKTDHCSHYLHFSQAEIVELCL